LLQKCCLLETHTPSQLNRIRGSRRFDPIAWSGEPFANSVLPFAFKGYEQDKRKVPCEVVVVTDGVETIRQSLLNSFKWYLLLDKRLQKLLEELGILDLMISSGEAVAHVEPL
jgi:hypothetical protein